MRHAPLAPKLFTQNRARLVQQLPPKSITILNANDVLPTNADGSFRMRANSDLYHQTGIEQEETKLLLFPDADDENLREILFLREPNPKSELWEGHKLRADEATKRTGIKQVKWLSEFPGTLHRLIGEAEHVYLNTNEHKRAACEVETRDDRFISEIQRRYPLHDYRRLAPLMHTVRSVKTPEEVAAIQRACDLTAKGFRRVLRFTKPGRTELELEAELAHEFIRGGGRFAYDPIIATGANACVLHYLENSAELKAGQLLLLDVAAACSNYNSDLTRTIPVSGKFTKRQRAVYNAVLRVLQEMTRRLAPGLKVKDWQKQSEALMTEELLQLGLLKASEVKKQPASAPAVKKYFMHGLGHPIGLDVHDVGDMSQPMQPGWVMTVEPGIYIPEEKLGVRLENTVLVTKDGPKNLMVDIPIEADEIEALMQRKRKRTAESS